MGAVTDNGCRPFAEGDGQDGTGIVLQVNAIKENAGVGHCLIAMVTWSSRERLERGFSESFDWWWGGGQGASVDQEWDPVRLVRDCGKLKRTDGRCREMSKAGAAPWGSCDAVDWAEFCPTARMPVA